jgi:hypothetical protein
MMRVFARLGANAVSGKSRQSTEFEHRIRFFTPPGLEYRIDML